MMAEVDEIYKNKIFEMNQIEFQEALARISEESCLEPLEGVFSNGKK